MNGQDGDLESNLFAAILFFTFLTRKDYQTLMFFFLHFSSSDFRFLLSSRTLKNLGIMSQGSDAGQGVLSLFDVFSIILGV